MKKNYLVKNLFAVAMLLSLTMGLVSCQGFFDAVFGSEDKPVSQPTTQPEQPKATVVIVTDEGAKVEASNAEEVSKALGNLVDDIKAKGVGDGKEYIVELSGVSIESTASENTIVVPKIENSNISLVFTDAVTSTSTSLVVKASETASTESTTAVNQLTITVPNAESLDLKIDMPETTVTLKTSGTSTVFKSVIAKTATSTLIIENGVTVEELEIQGGNVVVKNGGAVNMLVCPTSEYMIGITDKGVTYKVTPDMALFIPYATEENGDPYSFQNLKVIKGTADYASLYHTGQRPESYSIKTLIIGDGAAVNNKNYTWEEIETIKGEGNARYIFGYWLNLETDDPIYAGSVNFGQVKSMTGVAVSALWDEMEDKFGLQISALPASTTDCSFKAYGIYAQRLKGANAISVKNCKFERYDNQGFFSVYSSSLSDGETSFKTTFDNCEFADNTKFNFTQKLEDYAEVTIYYWTKIVDGAIFPGGSSTSLDDVPEANKEVGETSDKYDTSKNPVEGYPMSMGYWKDTHQRAVLPVDVDKFDFTIAFNNCKYGTSAMTASTPVEASFNPTEVQGLNFYVEIDGTKYTSGTEWDEASGKTYWKLTK